MSRIVNESTAFAPEDRRKLLDKYFEALARWQTADVQGLTDDEAIQTIAELWDEYRAKLPIVRVAKNPFTGEPFDHSIDVFGLDGLWWNYRNPTRPAEYLPPTVLAFTGAIRLSPPVESAPYLCRPGPGLPFVVPRILEQEGVKAVLSSIPISAHTGYAVVYFAEKEMRSYEGFNTWGVNESKFAFDEDDYGWYTWQAGPEDYCFDLRPWIESGKLQWIDTDENLRGTVDGCPYLDMEGERLLQVIQEGEVWTEEPWYTEEPPEVVGSEEPEHTIDADKPDPAPTPQASTRFCRNCGTQVKPDAAFCPSCGTRL